MVETKENKTTLEMINGLAEIAEYMKDEELNVALTMIAKLIIKPDIPINVATLEIVRLQAIAAKMSFKATWMANVDKTDRAAKNIYYTAASEIDKLVNSLKFLMRL
jgi:predicted S18 family serine protease